MKEEWKAVFRGRTVYLSGPMTGLPDLNRAKFDRAEKFLKEAGAKQVINPQHTRLLLGDDREKFVYLKIDSILIEESDMIVLLPGWHESEGCATELQLAARMDMPCICIESISGVDGEFDIRIANGE